MSQLPLPMAWSQRGGPESLLIHSANAQAIAFLRDWQRWPSPAAILTGPPRSGRTLAGRLFVAQSGGHLVDAADRADEEQLFHLWNQARDTGRPLLMIADDAPPLWQVGLPDLRTRLNATGVARIGLPDEAVIAALIAHGLEHAGSAFAPDVPEYFARRLARCYALVDTVVSRLNAFSLASGQKISIGSARQTLCNEVALEETDDTTFQQRG